MKRLKYEEEKTEKFILDEHPTPLIKKKDMVHINEIIGNPRCLFFHLINLIHFSKRIEACPGLVLEHLVCGHKRLNWSGFFLFCDFSLIKIF